MKKTLLLTLATGLVGATPLMAVDLFITGSTAFRSNVHDACTNLIVHDVNFHEYTGTAATGGDTKTGNAAAQWTVTGTAVSTVTNVSGTLTIHALFTGSVQGIQTVEQGTKLLFLDAAGNKMTNTPTIAFTDVSSTSTPYPASGNYTEESVAVQPFVLCKAASTNNGLASITGVSWEQLKYAIQAGRIPLSAWNNNPSSHSNFVYLLERTQDSGTRRTSFATVGDGYNQNAVVYVWDATNSYFYKGTNSLNTTAGSDGFGVVGAAGNGNANLNWGPGYVGGGDIKTALNYSNSLNQSIAYLSLADAKGITGSASTLNWSQVISFDGLWPTAAGVNIHGNAGTNDFSPITLGMYPHWANEVVVYPTVDPSSLSGDQNLTATQLGDQNTPGSILGVLDYVTTKSTLGTPAPVGSIENEIVKSQVGGATAIRLVDMTSFRFSVGGTITP